MKYTETNKPLVCMQTQSTCYKGTRTMKVLGVLWHSTGANNPYLKRYVQPSDNAKDRAAMLKLLGTNAYGNDWNHISRQAGLNCWIGKLADGTVTTVQTMPWNYRPWGCGSGSKGSCNTGWIQFEICEDGLTDKTYFNAAYREACEITAYLCKLYGIDPQGTVTVNGVRVPTILCHWDSYKLGMGGGHSDIYHWFNKHGKDMDDVRRDVAALLSGAKKEESEMTRDEVLALVREEIAKADADDVTKQEAAKVHGDLQVWVTKAIQEAVAGALDKVSREVFAMHHRSYERLEDVPEWYRPTVEKLVNAGVIQGTGEPEVLNLSDDFCRIATVLDRLGRLD